MLLLWPCLLFLITLYVVVDVEVVVVIVVNVDIVALLVVTGHIIFSCGQ